MCLERGKRKKREYIRKLKFEKDKYIELWKVFDINKAGEMIAQFHNFTFQKGKNTATGDEIETFGGGRSDYQYEPGFHCFLSKDNAEKWREEANNLYHRNRVVKSVKVRKSWITNVGFQCHKHVIVCKHIFI